MKREASQQNLEDRQKKERDGERGGWGTNAHIDISRPNNRLARVGCLINAIRGLLSNSTAQ